jgi:NDP-sugar pyrophosphorylase family protein
MSGAGSRFARAGYQAPKPLITVDGRPMIEHVIRMFPGVTDFIFICSRRHLETTPLESVLRRNAPTGRIVPIEPHKLGPVYATLQAESLINNNEPIIVNYCDFAVGWDFADFCRTMDELRPSGALTAYRGFHPHTLGPNLYAYTRHEDNWLLEIQEKTCFTDNRMNEFASSGTYYFSSGAMLKRYYCEAISHGLSTGGEYYASMPYNLMVDDGEPVYIYELEKFLQWGTPEDLEEYQSWSGYFADAADWSPRASLQRGSLLIPMAGDGARFAREGYREPKPLVPVAGVPMIDRVLHTLPHAALAVAVCRAEHLNEPALEASLCNSGRETELISLDRRTEGQACTCLLAEGSIPANDPVLVSPCDSSLIYDENAFAALVAGDADCVAFTFRNHPHANRNPKQYGWVQTVSNSDLVESVICKKEPKSSIPEAHGITGMFWFREARVMFQAIRELIVRNERTNGEFYLDSVLAVLIGSGYRVRSLNVKHYICYGTPDEVRTFEYWEDWFRRNPDHRYAKPEQGKESRNDSDQASLVDCLAVL